MMPTTRVILLVTISFIVTTVVILLCCKCVSFDIPQLESYIDVNASPTVCRPDEECGWAKYQVSGFIDRANSKDNVSVYATPQDAMVSSQFRSMQHAMIDACIHLLRTTPDFVAFFDDMDYKGRVFLVPARDSEWTNKMRTDIFATPDDPKPPLQAFIEDFRFYYGRKFSCIVPPNIEVVLQPVRGASYPGEPIVLAYGYHPQVVYYKGPIDAITITKQEQRKSTKN